MNSAELAKGWIQQADSIAALASRLGLSCTTLEETVKAWNRSCEAQEDLDFDWMLLLAPIGGTILCG